MGSYYEDAEPFVPLPPPEDDRSPAVAIECYCGTIWYPDYLDSCPSCGREEGEEMIPDEVYFAE